MGKTSGGGHNPSGGAGPGHAGQGLGLVKSLTKRRWPRRLLISANLVVFLLIAMAASAYGYIQWSLSRAKRIAVHNLVSTGSSQPMTILLVGSDTRDLGKGASAAFGNDKQVTGQRSDTMVLVRVVPATSSIALLSIPRDLLVNVPGIGFTRINAAFGGGPDLLVKTIEEDIGIPINHFAVVNFATFTKLSDAVGGVYQYFPTPARDLFSNLVVPNAGCVLLKGPSALSFVRSREYQYYLNGTWQYQLVPESDLARIQRQQAFIKAVIKKAEHVAPTNPLTAARILSGVTSSLTVDSSFSNNLMINLALDLRHTNAAGIPDWTYPNVNSTSVPGALDTVPSADQAMVHAFLTYGLPPNINTTTTTNSTSSRAITTRGSTGTGSTGTPTNTSGLEVEVLNGSGISGQAAQAASELKTVGVRVAGTGNAGGFNFTASVVQYTQATNAAAAQALSQKIGGGAKVQRVAGLASDKLVLVTGQNFSGVTSGSVVLTTVTTTTPTTTRTSATAAAATPSTAPPTSPSAGLTQPPTGPDSSSYYHGTYVPPGLMPGQVPKTCPP